MTTITLPHNFEPRPHQVNFLKKWDEGYKRLILIAHRRMGKDKMVFANLPKKMMERVGTYWYLFPNYNQARKAIWKGADNDGFRFLDHFPKEIVKNINEQLMLIELTNGSILQLVGADKVDSLVGTNPVGVVFSEMALMKKSVWSYISPILAANDGWAVFVSTPRGKNHFYHMVEKNKDNPRWHIETLPVNKTNSVSQEILEEERGQMSEAHFQQEYYCSFTSDDQAVFRNPRACVYEEHYEPKGNIFQLGIDLAKVNDETVIVPVDLATFTIFDIEAFNQIDYPLQKARIEATYRRLNKPRLIMDGTGVGVPIIDDLRAKGINVESYVFTQKSRVDLLTNLQIKLEQKTIRIPNNEKLLEQLESMQFVRSDETSNTRMQVPDGQHDDYIMALALAVWDLPSRPVTQRTIEQGQQTKGVEPMYEGWF